MPISFGKLTMDNEDDLIARAYAAYKKAAKRGGYVADEPALGRCHAQECEGKFYVVLNNNSQTLAVFLIKPDGVLHRLSSPPKSLEV